MSRFYGSMCTQLHLLKFRNLITFLGDIEKNKSFSYETPCTSSEICSTVELRLTADAQPAP